MRGLPAPGGARVVATPLGGPAPQGRRHIGLSADDVAALTDGWTDGWGEGCWYDLEPGGIRSFAPRS
ncbi:hypothetical protein [Streptomyces avermitilis]|uniref:hypothetical protein n=1 Tax=Streptomyces avermitilis TaxID=33903 RepID=UPI0038275870